MVGRFFIATLISRNAYRSLRYIFFLCGFGYFIDLLYAQAFGLVAPALQNELGFSGQYHQVPNGNVLKTSGRQTLW